MSEEYEKIPINCQICEHFLEDDYFIEEFDTKFVCTSNDETNPKFLGFDCDDFGIGKWLLVEFLKRLSGGEKEGMLDIPTPLFDKIEVKSADNQSDNSKPPEPCIWIAVCQKYDPESLLCSETPEGCDFHNEPRENDITEQLKRCEECKKLIQNITKQELILKFLKKIRHIPLFWAFDDYLREVYEEIDKIRDFYQKELKGESE